MTQSGQAEGYSKRVLVLIVMGYGQKELCTIFFIIWMIHVVSSLSENPFVRFLQNIANYPEDIKGVSHMYRMGQMNDSSHFPVPENMTYMATGLPGTNFQPIPDQNIADICIARAECNPNDKYRTINGSCNNLFLTMWGLTGTALVRLLPASYEDGLHHPKLAVSGRPLPNPRQLRNILLPNRDIPDHINTRIVMEWGQIISHDTTHISILPVGNLGGLQCCDNGQYPQNLDIPAQCMPIQVFPNDTYFGRFNQTCLNFVRAVTTTDYGCSLAPQQQMAMVTHFVDASWVYGSYENVANDLREGSGGRLRVYVTADGRDFPPYVENATQLCHVSSNNGTCYFSGDVRVNQNTDVTVLHVIFLREHNKLCAELSEINPHWDDERLYQEARRILIASVQRITYTDFLIVLLGRNYSSMNRILDYDFDQLYDGYETMLNPTSINEFTSAAYRALHNIVPSTMDLTKENRCPRKSLIVSDWYFRPSVVQEPGNLDGLVRSLATQRSNKFNNYFSPQVSDKLFIAEAPYGSDLAAIDVQRGRDCGIRPYNDYRVACGLPRAQTFSDFSDFIGEQDIQSLREVYESVDDVELYVAGLMEQPIEDSITGPTFRCIIGEQFARWRNGDRYYYQFSNQSGSFTPGQYAELRKLGLSLIFCRNGDNIENIQPNVFHRPSSQNRLMPCSQFPQLNLSLWRES